MTGDGSHEPAGAGHRPGEPDEPYCPRHPAPQDDVQALPARTRELVGLVASLVAACEDCTAVHLWVAARLGVHADEIAGAVGMALPLGGAVTLSGPRAVAAFGELTAVLAARAGVAVPVPRRPGGPAAAPVSDRLSTLQRALEVANDVHPAWDRVAVRRSDSAVRTDQPGR